MDTPATRVCSQCFDEWPLKKFRPRSKVAGERMGVCNKCHGENMTLYRLRKRYERTGRLAAEILKAEELSVVRALACAAFRAYGGKLGFCLAWKETFDAALPGSPTRRKMLQATMQLGELVSAQTPRRDVSTMDDAELAAHLERLERKMGAKAAAEAAAEAAASG